MRTLLLIIGLWTFIEGGFTLVFPHSATRLAGCLSKRLHTYLNGQSMKDIRLLGGIELLFGLGLLLAFLFGPR